MTWSNGRQLDSTNVGGMNLSYSYNADGQRTSKSRSAYYTDEYVYYGTQLSTLIRNGVGYKHSMTFIYDDNGQALGFYYDTNLNDSNPGTKYYYVCNAQGDVLQLRDHTNAPVANYYYDSWGKLLGITDANGNAITAFNSVAVLNPIRYRGYFYDTETGFYYLNSRYYDPQIGRFINADNQLIIGSDMTSMNLFAYCGNNPVNRIDPTGEAWWHWALGAVVVVTCAVATVVTAGGFAAAAGAVAAVGSGVAAATTASTVAAGAFIGSATVYGMAVVSAASTSSTPQEFADQGNWGTVAATAGGAVWGGASAYVSTRTPTTKVYRSVSNAEAQDIKATGKFNLVPGGMESKQFGFDLAETRQFGNMMCQNTIVSAKVPTNMLNQFYTGGVDTSIFRSGTLTVYGDQLAAFNQAVGGTIKFMP